MSPVTVRMTPAPEIATAKAAVRRAIRLADQLAAALEDLAELADTVEERSDLAGVLADAHHLAFMVNSVAAPLRGVS